jgi:hypothetical protein
MGAFVGGELYPSWMHFFQAPLLPLSFIYCFFSFFLLQGPTRGHCLGVVTKADSVTHWYFHKDDKAGS